VSWQATTWVVKHSQHKGSALLTMLMLANHAGPDGGTIYPSLATLAAETRLSRRQVIRIIDRLLESGELVQIPGLSYAGTRMYAIPGVGGDNLSPGADLAPPPVTSEGGASDILATGGDIFDVAGDIAVSPELYLEQSLELPLELKTRASRANGEDPNPNQPTQDQLYLLKRLFMHDSNWSEVTIPAIVELNKRYGRRTVHIALGRLREDPPVSVGKAYGLLQGTCEAVAAESVGA